MNNWINIFIENPQPSLVPIDKNLYFEFVFETVSWIEVTLLDTYEGFSLKLAPLILSKQNLQRRFQKLPWDSKNP